MSNDSTPTSEDQSFAGGAPSPGFAWHPLGEGMFGNVSSAVVVNGDLYAGGSFRTAGEVEAPSIAVWRDGAWHAVTEHFSQPVNAFLLHDGVLHTGGNTADRARLYGLVRRTPSGDFERLGDPLQDGFIEAMVPFKDEIVVAGGFINIGLDLSGSIARWDGQKYHAMSDLGPNNAVYALAVFKGDLYAAGWFRFHDSWEQDAQPINGIARWDGQRWHPVGGGLDESAYALAVFGGKLFVGGDFTAAGEVPANRIAAWDGKAWTAAGDGVDGLVRSLTLFDDGSGEVLVAGGQFETAGGVRRPGIAAWDGSRWHGFGDGFDAEVSVVLGIAAGPLGPALLAGGDFYASGATDLGRIAIWRRSNPSR